MHSCIRKETIQHDDKYVLIANERIKISPFHAFNIEVTPNKPFSITEDDGNEYEITSIKETPCVANGIIIPREHMALQVANLIERTIMIYRNQPLATMNRLNQAQLNMMQLGTTSPTTKQMASKPDNELSLNNTDLDDHQKEHTTTYPKACWCV